MGKFTHKEQEIFKDLQALATKKGQVVKLVKKDGETRVAWYDTDGTLLATTQLDGVPSDISN